MSPPSAVECTRCGSMQGACASSERWSTPLTMSACRMPRDVCLWLRLSRPTARGQFGSGGRVHQT
jgi:hypothetical protein